MYYVMKYLIVTIDEISDRQHDLLKNISGDDCERSGDTSFPIPIFKDHGSKPGGDCERSPDTSSPIPIFPDHGSKKDDFSPPQPLQVDTELHKKVDKILDCVSWILGVL